MTSFDLQIVTPQGQVFHGPVDQVVLPGTEGEFGVLRDHERFLTPLVIGEVEITAGGRRQYAAIAEGFAEVRCDHVAVLVESCELAENIDIARAERAHARAQQDLAQLPPDADRARYEQYEAALQRAKNRLEISKRST